MYNGICKTLRPKTVCDLLDNILFAKFNILLYTNKILLQKSFVFLFYTLSISHLNSSEETFFYHFISN